MPALQAILDFLELRRVFALRAIQVVWWLYLCQRLYGTNWGFSRIMTTRGQPVAQYFSWFDFFFTPVRVLVALATVRLLLEVLLAFLMPASRPTVDRTLGQDLLAFLDLRPFFTRWWLQIFWWLYLLTFLRSAYPYFVFTPPWVYAGSIVDWVNFFNGLLNHVLWLVGVRLLVETALYARRPAKPESTSTNP